MSFLSTILGGAAAKPIDAVGSVLDKLFTSDEEKLDKKIILQRLAQQPALVQAEINKVEAAHRSIFVAGWRPFIGWVCGLGLFNVFLLNPWLQWITNKSGPDIQSDLLLDLVIALLGLGAFRTFEKIKGRAK